MHVMVVGEVSLARRRWHPKAFNEIEILWSSIVNPNSLELSVAPWGTVAVATDFIVVFPYFETSGYLTGVMQSTEFTCMRTRSFPSLTYVLPKVFIFVGELPTSEGGLWEL